MKRNPKDLPPVAMVSIHDVLWHFPGLQFTSLCLEVDHASNHQNEVYFHVRRQTRPESWDVSSWPLRDDMKNSVTVYLLF